MFEVLRGDGLAIMEEDKNIMYCVYGIEMIEAVKKPQVLLCY
jgi:hypothetical protein